MAIIHPQYITDTNGKKLSIVIPIAGYEQIIEELDEFDDIRLYDEAKANNETSLPFDEFVGKRLPQ